MGPSILAGVQVYDPLRYTWELPLKSTIYPFGFPLEISTNSTDVLATAAGTWGGCPQWFRDTPLEIRVAVDRSEPDEHATNVAWWAQRRLISLVSDARNFAVCDLEGGFAYCSVTRATALDRAWFRAYYFDTMTNLLLWYRGFTGIHAGAVSLDGDGVLLCGPSGAGKSCLSYACVRNGWTFVSDESPCILPGDGRTVAGKPRQIHFRESAFELFPELLGRPVAPNPVGKISFEVAIGEEPGVKTAPRCEVAAVVLLNRTEGAAARLVKLSTQEACDRLEADLPLFAEPAHEQHRAAIRRLVEGGAYELRYEDLDSAVNELAHLVRWGGAR